jgi:hypothetical protein
MADTPLTLEPCQGVAALALADLLDWLNRRGGLGYDAHDRISAALASFRAATSAATPEYTREEMREACRNNYRAGQQHSADLAERERPTVAQIAAIIQRWQSQPLTTSEISDGAAREIAGATVVPMERRVEVAAMALCEEIRRVEGSSSMTWEEMTEPDRRDALRLVEVTIRAAAAATPEPPA